MAKKLSYILLLLLTASSCSKYAKLERNGTVEEKYVAAIQYYQEQDYYKCTSLLDHIMPFINGKDEFEDAIFVYAESYFYQKEYILAGHYYNSFITKFPRNEKIQLAEYMIAKSLYMQSPKVALDQSETKNAIASLQNFLNKYPHTDYSTECNNLIIELHQKLVDKAYRTSKLHMQIRNYKAAVASFTNFSQDFPDSDYNEELAYLKVKAQLELAKASVEKVKKNGKIIHLQKDRYNKVIEYYFDFIDSYQESTYAKTAENYYKTALNNTKI